MINGMCYQITFVRTHTDITSQITKLSLSLLLLLLLLLLILLLNDLISVYTFVYIYNLLKYLYKLYSREIPLLYIKICECMMLKYYIDTVFIFNLVFLNYYYYYFSITDSSFNPYHILSYLYLLIIILSYLILALIFIHTYPIYYTKVLTTLLLLFLKKPPLVRSLIRRARGVTKIYMTTFGVPNDFRWLAPHQSVFRVKYLRTCILQYINMSEESSFFDHVPCKIRCVVSFSTIILYHSA